MKVKLVTVFFLTLCCLTALAQERDVVLNSRWEGKNAIIYAEKKTYGTYTVLLKFDVLENCNQPTEQLFTLRANAELLRLKPSSENSRLNFRYAYRYIPGVVNPKLSEEQLYRIPIAASKIAKIKYLYNLEERFFGKPASGKWKAFQFFGQQGDTLYAMRKGEVIKITNEYDIPTLSASYSSQNNFITVQHADGTLARYGILAKDSFMVREGDMVYPDTPLALLGTLDGEQFETRVQVFYPTYDRKAAKLEDTFSWQYIDPLFVTSEGVCKLDDGKTYQPLLTSDLLCSEMSKKELKKRGLK